MYPNYRKSIFPYTNKDGTVTWVVEFPDLPGCSAVGNTEAEALLESQIACELWLDEYFAKYESFPVPKEATNNYSGKFVVRLPKTLHKELAIEADEEGISLNSLIITLLAQNFGKRISKPIINVTIAQTYPAAEDDRGNIKYEDSGIGKIIKYPTVV